LFVFRLYGAREIESAFAFLSGAVHVESLRRVDGLLIFVAQVHRILRPGGCKSTASARPSQNRGTVLPASDSSWFLDTSPHPLESPGTDGVDRRAQLASLFCQRVLHADGSLRNDDTLDDALVFEFLQTLAEHPVGDVGNGAAERGEAAARTQE